VNRQEVALGVLFFLVGVFAGLVFALVIVVLVGISA
jgi:hypothetical protein